MNDNTERLKEFLNEKITHIKKRIHPEHSSRFNHDIHLEIDCYEWVLGKIEVNKISFDRLEGIIRATIKDLEKRKDRAMVRTETGDSTKPQAPAGIVLKQQLDAV